MLLQEQEEGHYAFRSDRSQFVQLKLVIVETVAVRKRGIPLKLRFPSNYLSVGSKQNIQVN